MKNILFVLISDIRGLLTLLFLMITAVIFSQNTLYEIDLTSTSQPSIRYDDLKAFSGTSPDGTTLGVNNRYFTKNGEPWFPLMGEFHFTRYPRQYWEEEIVKMKNAGLSIVATYIFWNAHENTKGTWNWSGNEDLRYFVELCRKHGMYVWLRIGPWSHGEQLFGGHPLWIKRMRGKRSNNKEYLAEAEKLYKQIGKQVSGLFFKDGGPVIGIQLENEYASGDIDHIGTLKKMALDAGMKPVYFTITGNSVFHEDRFEAIPLQGGYPYRGWESEGGKATKDFLYGNDQWIMTDALGKVFYNINNYPKGLCEQGCGSQMTYRNRFVVEPEMIEAHLQNQIGRGMNLIGYYMFQGGTQMPGLKEGGYPESYDFQAPLSEFGLIRPSYKYLKVIHNFIRDFGSELAPMVVVEQDNPVRDENSTKDLRYIVRASGNHGYLFLNNTQVRIPMPDKSFRMKVKLKDETIEFPRKRMVLKGEKTAILPFNLNVNGALMKYVTAQPLSRFNVGGKQWLFLTRVKGMDVELAFDAATIKEIDATGWDKQTENGMVYLTSNRGGVIEIISIDGKQSSIVLLSRAEAENSWRTNINGRETLIITNADLISDGNRLDLRQLDSSKIEFSLFPKPERCKVNELELSPISEGVFSRYRVTISAKEPDIKITNPQRDEAMVEIPRKLPDGISDIFLEVKYFGSDITALHNDSILTDNLFNGQPWMFGLKRYINGKSRQIRYKVKPWNNRITGVPKELADKIKKEGTTIESIKVHPQYRVVVEVE